MEHLDFILWMVLWPLCAKIGDFFYVKTQLLKDEKPNKSGGDIEMIFQAAFYIYWILVGYQLWNY